MSTLFKVLFVLFITLVANVYLLRPGLWTFQDASYWPKSDYEAYAFLNQQFQTFTTYGYYLGYDQGLLSFTRIFPVSVIYFLFKFFGSDGSQAAFSVFGMVLTFVSFYKFSEIFNSNSLQRYLVSLGYTFSPWAYQLQGHTYFVAIAPLFLYSFHSFVVRNSRQTIYLLLMTIALLMWVSYIRFVQAYFIVIFPFVLYWMWIVKSSKVLFKLLLVISVFILVISPTLAAFFIQISEGGQTAFSYSQNVGFGINNPDPLSATTFLYSNILNIYDNTLLKVVGVLLFVLYLGILAKIRRNTQSVYFSISCSLFTGGLLLYNLGSVVNSDLYFLFLKIFPFVTNNSFFALYVLQVPVFIILLLLTKRDEIRISRIFIFILVISSTLPLLNTERLELRQLKSELIPKEYSLLFPGEFGVNPEATLYLTDTCWAPKYSVDINIPKPCLNLGYKYSSISLIDPRLATKTVGEVSKNILDYRFEELSKYTNLKHVIYPHDTVDKKHNELATNSKIQRLISSNDFRVNRNNSFTIFSAINYQQYDYFLYITSLEKDTFLKTEYKFSIDNPNYYLIKISNIESGDKILRLARSFSNNWNVQIITKEDYEKYNCIGESNTYILSNNQSCLVDIGFLQLFLNKSPNKISINHMKTAFSTNEWRFSTTNDEDSNLYLLISYKKSKAISLFIVLSFITIIGVTFHSIWILLRIKMNDQAT